MRSPRTWRDAHDVINQRVSRLARHTTSARPTRDGSPLPEWITMDKRGLAIIERPVDADEIHLVVKAIRADGKVFEIPVVVQGTTGEIQLDTPLPSAKISAADTLSKTLAAATAAANDETATLAAAFSSQA